LKINNIENAFLSENLMKFASLISVSCGVISIIILGAYHETSLLILFEKLVKICTTLILYWAFSKYHWDVMRGMMGGVLFCLLYQESFLVLGNLWGGTVDFDTYLIMGVQGSLYLAAESMSFMMTLIITINHFIISYSNTGNIGNVIFNQIAILFKIILYISLIIINAFIELPTHKLVISAFEYITDFCIIIILICIESQLDNFKQLRKELLQQKKTKEVHS